VRVERGREGWPAFAAAAAGDPGKVLGCRVKVLNIEQTASNRSVTFVSTFMAQVHHDTGSKMGFPEEVFLSQTRQEMEKDMKPSTTDQAQGKLHEVKGDVKEKVGQVTGNPDLTNEGQAERLAGNVQKKVGQVEKVFGK
jgi:uncharacterized protein YjbJ (UPF0337 family)